MALACGTLQHVKRCYIGGAFGRKTALNYCVDALSCVWLIMFRHFAALEILTVGQYPFGWFGLGVRLFPLFSEPGSRSCDLPGGLSMLEESKIPGPSL